MTGHCARLDGAGKRFGDLWVLRDVTLALPAQRTTAIEERLYDGFTADADRSHTGPYQVVDFSMDCIYKLWLAHGLTTVRAVGSNRGGRVTAGSDAGYVWCLYGFCYVRELELLQEAGFNPLEVLRTATLHGAEALGIDGETGSIEIGKKADLVIVSENPLDNFKVLYGTGALRLDADDKLKRVGGVEYTVKDGVVTTPRNCSATSGRWWRKPRRKRALRKARCPWKGFSALRLRLHAP